MSGTWIFRAFKGWTAAWAGALALVASAHSAPDTGKPNVLFIAVDDLRPELGCYGNPLVHSPNIDRLAARGTVFSRAYCQQAVCSPSRSSLMTGRHPDATRVWDLKTHFRAALPDVVTLPQHFKSQGYRTVSLGKIYHHGFEDGRSWSEPAWYASGLTVETDLQDFTVRTSKRFGPGVREYTDDSGDPDASPAESKRKRRRLAFEASARSDDELPDGATAAEAVRRLHQFKETGQPFFLAVGFVKPHLPFIAPKKYWDLYDPDQIPRPTIDQLPEGAPEFAGHASGELHNYGNIPQGNPIPEDLALQLRHGYYACISYVDAQVGRLLDALDQEGLADKTVVVLWGDHGWQLGDHGIWAKHTNFELATRSPLIIAVPGQQVAGAVSRSLVEFVDLYPTLIAACGLETPAQLDGLSLMPLLNDPSASIRPVAVSQYPRGGGNAGYGPLMGYSIRDERWRLTVWRDRREGSLVATELYDEQNDRAETVNVAASNPEVVARLTTFIPPFTKFEPRRQATAPQQSPSSVAKTKPSQSRATLFARKDRNQDEQLDYEEFSAYQSDPQAARERFLKWDADGDGGLSDTEFITRGAGRKN